MALLVTNLPANPWVGNIPWSRKWQPTPVFLPGESHGQRNLVDYSHEVSESDWVTITFTLIVMNPQIFEKLIFSPLAQYHE